MRVGMGDFQLTTFRPKAQPSLLKALPASRIPVSGMKRKAGSAVEAVSVASAHIFAVAAMAVIAGLVIYAG